MTFEDRKRIAQSYFDTSHDLLMKKGKAYAGDEDALDNFKRNAKLLGLTPFQVWAVYFNKHIDSINNAIKQNPSNPVDQSEGLDGRIADVITYATILGCLLKEKKQNKLNNAGTILEYDPNNVKPGFFNERGR